MKKKIFPLTFFKTIQAIASPDIFLSNKQANERFHFVLRLMQDQNCFLF